MLMADAAVDPWSGLANLLTDMIEKYAAVLDLEDERENEATRIGLNDFEEEYCAV